jgi:hypothetical protein
MYTRFLESLFESQTYPNENESDPLGTDVNIFHKITTNTILFSFSLGS